jgi:hypothetical protein
LEVGTGRLEGRLRLRDDRQGRQRHVSDRGERKNPDTLERESATLIVNRQDDAFARKRRGPDDDADPPKCLRNYTISSTARLFPARPSPDIDNLGGSIR